MENAYSIIPPIVAILGAVVTKRILPALVVGLLAGSFLKSGGLVQGIIMAGEYLARVLADKGNAYIILFLFCFGALAELFKVGGGISGFAKRVGPYVKSERGALLSVWAVTPVTFLDCCFHVISTGSITKPMIEKVNGSIDKLAFIINTTSSQLIVLIPGVTTYVGYILGLIASSMARAGIEGHPYMVYLSAIPFNFYSIIILLISLLLIFIEPGLWRIPQPSFKQEDLGNKGDHDSHEAHQQCEFQEKVPPRIANLIVPMIFLVVSIVYLSWWTGHTPGASFWQTFLNAESEKVIFIATLSTIVLTSVLYVVQKIPMKELQSHFLLGGTDFLPPIIILILSWSIAAVTEDLGFSSFVRGLAGTDFPYQLVPLFVFLVAGVSSYFMGSSWATWALVMPIAIPLAGTSGASISLTVGAVLAGGSIGDNLSPLGETPVLTAAVTGINPARHVSYMLPYGLVAIALSIALYLVVGFVIG